MKEKKYWQKLWETAPTKQFTEYSALSSDKLREDGYVVTDDWARAMYLLQKYSGGGYLSAALGITSFWRIIQCRHNIPYGEQIGNIFFGELLYTFRYNRDIPTLL